MQTNLQVDNEYERRGSNYSKGLIIRGCLSILAHGLQERSIWDEEYYRRYKDPMKQADEKVLVVEQRTLLARQVQLWKSKTQLIIYVLQERKE